MPLTVTSLASPTAHRQHHLFEATYQRYLDAFNAHAYAKSPRRNEGSRNVAAKPPVSALALPGGTGASEPGTRAVDGEAAAREERDEEGRDLPGDGSSGSVPPPRVSGGLTSGGVVQEREGTLPLLSVQGAGLGRGAEIFGRELRTHKNGRDAVGSGSLSLESDSPTVTYAEEVACWAAQIKLTLTTSDSAEVESARLAFLRQTRSLLVKQLMLPWKEFVADVLPQFLREVHDARFRITGAIMDNVWKLRDQLEAATGVAAAPNANPPGVRCFGEELSSRPRPALPPESGSVCLGESVPNKGPGHCNGTFSFPTRGVHEGDKGGDPGSSGCSVSLSRTATQQLQSGGEGAREGAVSSKAMKQSGGSGSQNSVRLVGSGRGHETGVGVRAADVTGISTREPASTRCSLDLRSEDAAEAPRSPLPASGGARSGEAMAPLGTGRASKGGSVEFASASQLQPIGEDRVLASSASNSFSVSRAGSGEDTAEEGGRFGGVIRSKVGPSISSGTPVGVVTHMEHPGPGPYVRGGGAEGSGCDTSSSGTSGLSGVSATHVALDKAHSSNNTSTSVASSASAHVSVSQGSSASCVPTKKSEPFPPAGHHHAASKGGQSLIFTEQFSSDRSTAQAIGNLSQYESEGGTRVYGSSADFGEPPLHMGVTRMSPVGPAAEALEDFAWSNMTVGGGKGGGAGRSKSLTSKAPRAFGLVKMDALHPTKGLWGRGGGKKRDEEELNANLDFLLEEPLLLPVRQFHFCCYPQLPRTFFCVFDDLAPDTFECARELAGVTEQDYRSSVCRTDFSFIEFESNSKSGQFFLFSHDGKYLIKTISQREVKQVLKILPAYIDHLLTNPNSLLTRLFGLHRVEIYKRYDLEEEAPGGVSQEVEWSSRRSHTGGTDSQLDPRREDTSRTVTDRGSSGGSRRRPTIGSGGRHVSVAVPPEGASSGVTREFENDPVVSADGGGSGTASQSDFTRGGSSDSLACSWMPDESTAGDMASSDAVTGGKTMHLLLPSRTSAGVETSRTTGQAKATSRDSQRSSLSETRHTEYSVAEVACDPQLLREDKERSDRELFGSALNFCSTQLHAGEMSALYASDEGRSASLRAPSDPGSD
ncbi:phosphatidylinositol-4-phosphate 5-kinase, partial [Cystoisospora suis]